MTAALDEIWQRVRRLNRYVEEQAPWALAKDEARAGELDTVLASLAEGLRVLTVLLHPWLPEATATLLGALGSERRRDRRRAARRRAADPRAARSRRCSRRTRRRPAAAAGDASAGSGA